jgi:hypothetical protein
VQLDPESERFVFYSGYIILEGECGERLILLGLEEDWLSEGHTVFECECGETLTFADRVDEEDLSGRRLLRDSRTPDRR